MERANADIQLRVAQAACGLRFAARAGAVTVAAAVAMLAMIALAYGQAAVPEGTKADTAQPQSPTPQAPQIPPGTPPTATVIDKSAVQGVLGKDVRSATGENMGRIVDVVVDAAGAPLAAVIDFGGFLGVGSRKIAVDWNALHFAPGNNPTPVILDLNKDQVKAAPEYADKKPVVILGAAGVMRPVPQDEPAKPE
ncbi:MAG: PRC-barrel domain-containing protein [Stellaceae bacterium]